MDRNLLGIILSYVFVFSMIFIATLIQKLFKLSHDFSRKIIHIAVGNWIFIALYYFTDWYYAIIGPITFILLNYLSYKHNIFKAMELEEKNPGTVYYAISLTICTLFTFSKTPYLTLPFLGIMAMTWGDGFAAVIGKSLPIKMLRSAKSLGGSSAFFILTLIASLVYLMIINKTLDFPQMLIISLVAAFLGTGIEIFSPKNSDNLTVPLILGFIGFIMGM